MAQGNAVAWRTSKSRALALSPFFLYVALGTVLVFILFKGTLKSPILLVIIEPKQWERRGKWGAEEQIYAFCECCLICTSIIHLFPSPSSCHHRAVKSTFLFNKDKLILQGLSWVGSVWGMGKFHKATRYSKMMYQSSSKVCWPEPHKNLDCNGKESIKHEPWN